MLRYVGYGDSSYSCYPQHCTVRPVDATSMSSDAWVVSAWYAGERGTRPPASGAPASDDNGEASGGPYWQGTAGQVWVPLARCEDDSTFDDMWIRVENIDDGDSVQVLCGLDDDAYDKFPGDRFSREYERPDRLEPVPLPVGTTLTFDDKAYGGLRRPDSSSNVRDTDAVWLTFTPPDTSNYFCVVAGSGTGSDDDAGLQFVSDDGLRVSGAAGAFALPSDPDARTKTSALLVARSGQDWAGIRVYSPQHAPFTVECDTDAALSTRGILPQASEAVALAWQASLDIAAGDPREQQMGLLLVAPAHLVAETVGDDGGELGSMPACSVKFDGDDGSGDAVHSVYTQRGVPPVPPAWGFEVGGGGGLYLVLLAVTEDTFILIDDVGQGVSANCDLAGTLTGSGFPLEITANTRTVVAPGNPSFQANGDIVVTVEVPGSDVTTMTGRPPPMDCFVDDTDADIKMISSSNGIPTAGEMHDDYYFDPRDNPIQLYGGAEGSTTQHWILVQGGEDGFTITCGVGLDFDSKSTPMLIALFTFLGVGLIAATVKASLESCHGQDVVTVHRFPSTYGWGIIWAYLPANALMFSGLAVSEQGMFISGWTIFVIQLLISGYKVYKVDLNTGTVSSTRHFAMAIPLITRTYTIAELGRIEQSTVVRRTGAIKRGPHQRDSSQTESSQLTASGGEVDLETVASVCCCFCHRIQPSQVAAMEAMNAAFKKFRENRPEAFAAAGATTSAGVVAIANPLQSPVAAAAHKVQPTAPAAESAKTPVARSVGVEVSDTPPATAGATVLSCAECGAQQTSATQKFCGDCGRRYSAEATSP